MSVKGKDIPLNFDDARGVGRHTGGRPLALEKRLMARLLHAMGDPPLAVELWDGEPIYAGSERIEVRLRIHERRALWGVLTNPDLYFGDAYSDGRIDVDGSLLRLVEMGSARKPEFLQDDGWLGRFGRLFSRRTRRNTLRGSRENIHHHYDLSNDFYELWLDREYMQYTCAYFAHANATLEEAQREKLHHVCRKLQLKPGDVVIEAGCGWGGLSLFMAKEYGARVTAYNISHEQIVYATERCRREGLTDRIRYVEDDYRNATGACDVFVSVGMLEHVGVDNYNSLGGVIDRCLKQDGRGFIHSIGRNKPRQMSRWIERRIFPGAYPPTLGEMSDIFEPYDFSILDVENLRLHYAKTLEHWLDEFEQQRNRVLDMFDERFVRAWRLYLTGSIVSFRLGYLQLFQVLFNRGTDNNVAWTREHLYK